MLARTRHSVKATLGVGLVLLLTLGATPATGEVVLSGDYAGEREVIEDQTLRVVSLNLAHGRKDRLNQVFVGAANIRQSIGEIGQALQRLNVDVVALQEADGPSLWSGRFDHVELLSRKTGLLYHVRANHSKSVLFEFGTGFLSKVPLQNVRGHRFTPSWPTLSKGWMSVWILWNPEDRLPEPARLQLVSVHLDFSRAGVRQNQVEEITTALKGSTHPLIVMGDLNAEWSGEDPTVRIIARELDLIAHRPESSTLSTYPRTGRRLDWILVSRSLGFKSYTVVSEVLSDHSAILAEITLNKLPHNRQGFRN